MIKNLPFNNKYIFAIIFLVSLYLFFHALWFFCHGVFINVDATTAYIPQSKLAFFSKKFFIGGDNYIAQSYAMKARAYSYPLYLKFFSDNSTGLYCATLFQWLASLVTWLCFSLAIVKRIRHPQIALISFFLILLVSFTNGAIVWDRIISAESLSISSFLWILILFLKWSDHAFKPNRYLCLLILVSLFFSGLRDTNPYLLILLSVFLLGYAIFSSKYFYSGIFIFFGSSLFLFLANNAILEKAERWQAPFSATFIGRLACQSDQSAIKYFTQKYHMPSVPVSVKAYRGTVYGWDYIATKEPLAEWMKQYGKKAYTSYLITHPYYTWIVPLLPIKNNFSQCSDITKSFFAIGSGFKNINGKEQEIDYQRSLWLSLISIVDASVNLKGERVTSWPTIILIPIVDFICISALIGFIGLVVMKKQITHCLNKDILFSFFLLVSGIVMAFFVWHADSTAYPRHLILTVHQLSLSALMLFFFLLDKIMQARPPKLS